MSSGHEATTKGGWLGHWVRRAIHVGMILVPWLYYHFEIPSYVLWILFSIIIFVEIIRLLLGFQFFGQRVHEAKRISSFAWGGLSLCLVLLLVPPQFAYPIVAACAFGDPLIGELRRFRLPSCVVAVVGAVFIAGLWLLAWCWLGTPWWYAVIMWPLTVAAEWPNLAWIDDNAMMQLIPLIVVYVLKRFVIA